MIGSVNAEQRQLARYRVCSFAYRQTHVAYWAPNGPAAQSPHVRYQGRNGPGADAARGPSLRPNADVGIFYAMRFIKVRGAHGCRPDKGNPQLWVRRFLSLPSRTGAEQCLSNQSSEQRWQVILISVCHPQHAHRIRDWFRPELDSTLRRHERLP